MGGGGGKKQWGGGGVGAHAITSRPLVFATIYAYVVTTRGRILKNFTRISNTHSKDVWADFITLTHE